MALNKFVSELSRVRNFMLTDARYYLTDKPVLSQLLSDGVGRDFGDMQDYLEAPLIDPNTGTFYSSSPSIVDVFTALRVYTDDLDADLASPATRNLYRSGLKDADIRSDFSLVLVEILAAFDREIENINNSPDAESLGAAQGLLSFLTIVYGLMTGGLFYVLDFRDQDIDWENDSNWSIFFSSLTSDWEELKYRPEFRGYHSILSLSRDTLDDKPMLQSLFDTLVLNVIYNIRPPQNESSYTEGQLIASPEMLRGNFVSAKVVKGKIPPGMSFDPETGNVVVSDPSRIFAGFFGGTHIEVTNNLGETTNFILDIEITPDVEAEWSTLSPVIYIEDANKGDLVASVYDLDGEILETEVLEGKLPPGLSFNSSTATISVFSVPLLKAGEWEVSLRTLDSKGGTTDVTMTITVDPNRAPQTYVVSTPKDVDTYVVDDVVGVIPEPLGTVASTSVDPEFPLPPGTSIDSLGRVVVSDPVALAPGKTYKTFVTVSYTNGVEHYVDGYFEFYPASAFAYDEQVDKITNLTVGDSLANAPSGIPSIGEASKGYYFPPGVRINTTNGNLEVDDLALLQPGVYWTQVNLKYTEGGAGRFIVEVIVWPDPEITYIVNPAGSIAGGDYSTGMLIAYPQAAVSDIETATQSGGTMPPGVGLDGGTGEFTVIDDALLQAGSWAVDVETTSTLQQGESHTVNITINA